MIIVKDKSKNSPLFIPRNTIASTNNNTNNGGGIDVEELNKYLEDYVTDEELNDALNNIDITNIVELTQAEYNVLVANGDIDEEVIYLITDETINLKTINSESIIGDGDIPLATEEWVNNQLNTQIGAIETVLTKIIEG